MIKSVYLGIWEFIKKKPVTLWGITLLAGLISSLISLLCSGIAILSVCIGILISVSMTMMFLRAYRGEKVESVQLFDLFKDFKVAKRVIAGMLWAYLWIFVWSLIPVVGIVFGVIRAYRYRLVPYILITEPEVAPTDAIKVSEERTNGYKGAMFLTDLIAYGTVYAAILVLVLLALIPYIGGFFLLLTIALSLAFVAVRPLVMGLIKTVYYEKIMSAPKEEEVQDAKEALPLPAPQEPIVPSDEEAEIDVYESAPITTYTVEEMTEETRVDDEVGEPIVVPETTEEGVIE